MAKFLPLGAALSLFLGIGLWNAFGNRLSPSETGDVVQKRLATVPLTFGRWQGQDQPIHEKHLKVAHAEAYLNRNYTEAATGRTVNVLVIYGDPGELGAHDPKVCYGSIGHELAGPYSHNSLPGEPPNDFWQARFEKPNAAPFEVLWAWGTGGDWQAPDSPRMTFAGEGRIFKIYIQKPVNDPDALDATLIRELLIALKSAIRQP